MGEVKKLDITFDKAINDCRHIVEQYFEKFPSKREMEKPYDADFDDFISILPGMVCVFDLVKAEYTYVSKSVSEATGITRQRLYEEGIETLLTTFPEYDRKIFVDEIYVAIYKFMEEFASKGKAKDIKFSYQIRFQAPGKEPEWYLHNFMILDVADNGFPLTMSKYLHNINDVKKDDVIVFKFELKENGKDKLVFEKKFIVPDDQLTLTQRELEILSLVSSGCTNAEIADQLFISQETVKTHRKNMLQKNKMKNTGELIRYALKRGVLE